MFGYADVAPILQKRIYQKWAYATRYGRIDIERAARMPMRKLEMFLDAVADLVHEENELNKVKP